jgi:hypothetical protein
MKLFDFLKSINESLEPEPAPGWLIYVPPGGAAVECPTLEMAADAACRFAARHPGKICAVYERVGQAFVAYREPKFSPASSAPSEIEGPKEQGEPT